MDCCLKLANVDFVEPTRFQKGLIPWWKMNFVRENCYIANCEMQQEWKHDHIFSFSDWVDVCYFIHRRSSSNGHFLECCVPNCRFLDTFFDAHSSFQSIFHLHAVHVKKEEEESVRFKITIFKCTKIQFFVVQLQLFCWVELSCYWIQSWSRNFFCQKGFSKFCPHNSVSCVGVYSTIELFMLGYFFALHAWLDWHECNVHIHFHVEKKNENWEEERIFTQRFIKLPSPPVNCIEGKNLIIIVMKNVRKLKNLFSLLLRIFWYVSRL